jgi:peptidyl-prolyl cis-trans isomerase C
MNLRKLCGALVLCAPLTAFAEESQAPTPLVMVDDFAVTNLHYAIFSAQNAGKNDQSPEQQIALLNELVNTYMVANSDAGKKLAQHPEIAAAISVSTARLIAQALIREHLENAQISDEQLQTLYQSKYANAPGQELNASHILLETEDEAKAVIDELVDGADFAELAKAKSTGPSKTVGGDLGWFSPEQMVAPFSQAVLAMENGQFSKAPVETQFGWHVIKRVDARDLPTPSFEDVREELEKQLRTASLSKFIGELRDATKIEVTSGDAKVVE